MKILYKLIIISFLPLILSSCAFSNKNTESGKNVDDITINVGLLLGLGGLGDRSFNDTSFAGLLQAESEYGIRFDFIQPVDDDDIIYRLYEMAASQDFDLLLVIGGSISQNDAISAVVESFPEQKISHIDSILEYPTVRAVRTKWQEQVFFTGLVAGLGTISDMPYTSPENKVGMLIGEDAPIFDSAVAGYTAGARLFNRDVEVDIKYMDTFSDENIAYSMSMDMYNSGIDFIQSIGGGAGPGIHRASADAKKYSFATGANINFLEPDYIVATASRNVARLVFDEVSDLVNGTWVAGSFEKGILENSVWYDPFQSAVVLPEHIEAIMADVLDMIEIGSLVVPSNLDDLERWLDSYDYLLERSYYVSENN